MPSSFFLRLQIYSYLFHICKFIFVFILFFIFGRAASPRNSLAAVACSRRAIRSITLCALRARAGCAPEVRISLAPTGGSATIPLAFRALRARVCELKYAGILQIIDILGIKKTLSPLSEERALKTQTNKHKSVDAKMRQFFCICKYFAVFFLFFYVLSEANLIKCTIKHNQYFIIRILGSNISYRFCA